MLLYDAFPTSEKNTLFSLRTVPLPLWVRWLERLGVPFYRKEITKRMPRKRRKEILAGLKLYKVLTHK
jgi:hypothetical protein